MKKNFLYPVAAVFHLVVNALNAWAKQYLKEIVVVSVVVLLIAFGVYQHRESVNAPIVSQTDCGLILDIDDVGPDSRQSKIRTDKMIALTDLKFSSSIPGGSRLYYVVRSSGHKGWMIAH